jgi:hypothetical protein
MAEIGFVAQWAIILHALGTTAGADTALNAALVIVPFIVIAECFSWHAVLTKNYLSHAIENSIWAVAFFIIGMGLCRLLPEFNGPVFAIVSIAGIAGYLAFLATIDVPMYLTRWRSDAASGTRVRTHKDSFVFESVIHGLRQEAFDESRLFLADGRSVFSACPTSADRHARQASGR